MKLLLVTDASRAKGRVAFEKYLVSWLSVVGQVIGLSTPIECCANLINCSNNKGSSPKGLAKEDSDEVLF